MNIVMKIFSFKCIVSFYLSTYSNSWYVQLVVWAICLAILAGYQSFDEMQLVMKEHLSLCC